MMKRYIPRWPVVLSLLLLSGCAGFNRGCSSFTAGTFGSDWVVVQYRADGSAMNCWQLRGASVVNEDKSDGVYWQEPRSGHLVHIAGWYNRVQVSGGDFADAAKLLGVELNKCGSGKYPVVAAQ